MADKCNNNLMIEAIEKKMDDFYFIARNFTQQLEATKKELEAYKKELEKVLERIHTKITVLNGNRR